MALDKFKSKLEDLWLSEKLVGCIAEIYANTSSGNNDGIRVAVISICVTHIRQLLLSKVFLALIEGGGDFAVELMQELALSAQE